MSRIRSLQEKQSQGREDHRMVILFFYMNSVSFFYSRIDITSRTERIIKNLSSCVIVVLAATFFCRCCCVHEVVIAIDVDFRQRDLKLKRWNVVILRKEEIVRRIIVKWKRSIFVMGCSAKTRGNEAVGDWYVKCTVLRVCSVQGVFGCVRLLVGCAQMMMESWLIDLLRILSRGCVVFTVILAVWTGGDWPTSHVVQVESSMMKFQNVSCHVLEGSCVGSISCLTKEELFVLFIADGFWFKLHYLWFRGFWGFCSNIGLFTVASVEEYRTAWKK